jgi:hypothetical protein
VRDDGGLFFLTIFIFWKVLVVFIRGDPDYYVVRVETPLPE